MTYEVVIALVVASLVVLAIGFGLGFWRGVRYSQGRAMMSDLATTPAQVRRQQRRQRADLRAVLGRRS